MLLPCVTALSIYISPCHCEKSLTPPKPLPTSITVTVTVNRPNAPQNHIAQTAPAVKTKMAKKKPKRKKKKQNLSMGTFKVTAYCPCSECSEEYGNHTATGTTARQGRTIAVDPNVIPYGTVVEIKGLGEFVAEDCGGLVKGKHIDVYFDRHADTEKFGVQHREVREVKKKGA